MLCDEYQGDFCTGGDKTQVMGYGWRVTGGESHDGSRVTSHK